MTSNRPETSSAFDRPTTIAISVALALALLGAMWLIGQAFAGPAATAGPTATPEPWPTLPATLTPTVAAPTATLVVPPTPTMTPAPTPIMINQQRLGNLETFAVTMSTVHTETRTALEIAGLEISRDSVTINYVARVTLGVVFEDITFDTDGAAVTVNIPPVKILSVTPDWERSKPIGSETAIINNQMAAVVQEAWKKADLTIRAAVAADEELQQLAQSYTELLLEKHLRELGFERITIRQRAK